MVFTPDSLNFRKSLTIYEPDGPIIVGLKPRILNGLIKNPKQVLRRSDGATGDLYVEWHERDGRRVLGMPIYSKIFADSARQALGKKSPEISLILDKIVAAGLNWQDAAPLMSLIATKCQCRLVAAFDEFLDLYKSLNQSGLLTQLSPERQIKFLEDLIGKNDRDDDDEKIIGRLKSAARLLEALKGYSWSPRQKLLLIKKILRRSGKRDYVVASDFAALSYSLEKSRTLPALKENWTDDRVYLLIVKILNSRTESINGILFSWHCILNNFYTARLNYLRQWRLLCGLCRIDEALGFLNMQSMRNFGDWASKRKLTAAQWDDFIDTVLAVHAAAHHDQEGLFLRCFQLWSSLSHDPHFSHEERRAFLVETAQKSGYGTVRDFSILADLHDEISGLGIEAHEFRHFTDTLLTAIHKRKRPSDSFAGHYAKLIFEMFPSRVAAKDYRRTFALVLAILEKGKRHSDEVLGIIHQTMWDSTPKNLQTNLETILDIVTHLKPNQAENSLKCILDCLKVVTNTKDKPGGRRSHHPDRYSDHLRVFAQIRREWPTICHEMYESLATAYEKYPAVMTKDNIIRQKLMPFLRATRSFDWELLTLYLAKGEKFLAKLKMQSQGIYDDTMTITEARTVVEKHGWAYYLALVQSVAPFSKAEAALEDAPNAGKEAGPHAAQIAFGEKLLAESGDSVGVKTVPVQFCLEQVSLVIDESDKDPDGEIQKILRAFTQNDEKGIGKASARERLIAAINASAVVPNSLEESVRLKTAVLQAALTLAVHDSSLYTLIHTIRAAKKLDYGAYVNLEILERSLTDVDALPKVFGEIVGHHTGNARVDPNYFAEQGEKNRTLISADNFIKQLRVVWQMDLPPEKRMVIVNSMVTPFLTEEITSKILMYPDLESNLRAAIQTAAAKNPAITNMARQAQFLADLFSAEFIAAIRREKARYRKVRGHPIDLSLEEVHGPGYAFNGWTTGLCTADDITIRKRKMVKLLALKCPSQRRAVGFARAAVGIVDDKRSLILIDINPFPEFAQTVDAADLYQEWITAAKEFAVQNGYPGGVFLSEAAFIHSNDSAFKTEILLGHIDPTQPTGRRAYERKQTKKRIVWNSDARFNFSEVLAL